MIIGETAELGDNVTLYQGVTLGGTGKEKGKRHPTLGDYVTVGAGAKILGSFEVGDHCTIAANAVLLKPLEDNITAAGVPARVVKKDGVAVPRHSGESLPEEFREELEKRLDKFEKEMKDIKQKLSDLPSAGPRSEGFSEQGGG